MTVNELIKELNKIENKEIPVHVYFECRCTALDGADYCIKNDVTSVEEIFEDLFCSPECAIDISFKDWA